MRYPAVNNQIWNKHFKSQEEERLDKEAERQALIELQQSQEIEAKEAEQDYQES